MADPFASEQIASLTDEINQQLHDLAFSEGDAMKRGNAFPRAQRQRQAIEQATGQDATTFLARFREAARKDLCEQGGMLHEQWKRLRDLVSKDTLNTFGGILIGMGLSGTALQIVAVALTVYVLHLGAEAFCAGGESAMPLELALTFPDAGHVQVSLREEDDREDAPTQPFASPLDEKTREDLAWYLETYPVHYTTEIDDVRAAGIASRLKEWGGALFNSVFEKGPSARLFGRFQDASEDRLLTISSLDPVVLAQPWELLCDPRHHIPVP